MAFARKLSYYCAINKIYSKFQCHQYQCEKVAKIYHIIYKAIII